MTLQALHLSHVYLPGTPLRRVALEDVSLSVEQGECVAVVGVSGSGKSTLARILAGLTVPSGGQVLLDGVGIAATPRLGRESLRRLRAQLAQLRDQRRGQPGSPAAATAPAPTRPVMLAFQNPEDQFFTANVLEEVGVGFVPALPPVDPHRPQPPDPRLVERILRAKAAVMDALRLVELDPELYGKRNPFTLSGGEQRRLALAVLLARRPRVLILDEPSAGLDEPGRGRLYACIKRVRAELGTAVIVVSHDLEEVAEIADRVTVLRQGRVALEGPTQSVLGDAVPLVTAGLAPLPLIQLHSLLAARGFDLPGDWLQDGGAASALIATLRRTARKESAGA